MSPFLRVGCGAALIPLFWCTQLTASGGICPTAHQLISGRKKDQTKLNRDLFFQCFKLFSGKAKTCKVSFGFVFHFFISLSFFLPFPLKEKEVFFKTTTCKIKEESVRNFCIKWKKYAWQILNKTFPNIDHSLK